MATKLKYSYQFLNFLKRVEAERFQIPLQPSLPFIPTFHFLFYSQLINPLHYLIVIGVILIIPISIDYILPLIPINYVLTFLCHLLNNLHKLLFLVFSLKELNMFHNAGLTQSNQRVNNLPVIDSFVFIFFRSQLLFLFYTKYNKGDFLIF